MTDRDFMEQLLITAKRGGNLYLNGAIESCNSCVRSSFDSALKKSLRMQSDIFDEMSSRGWYQMTDVEQQKIKQTQQKYATG